MAKGRGGGSHKGLPPGMTASHGPEGLEIATMAPRSDEIAEQHVQSSTQKDISDEVYPPPRAGSRIPDLNGFSSSTSHAECPGFGGRDRRR